METIFITATNTDIGKTYTTLKLLQRFAKEKKRVGALKPIETGVDTYPIDGLKLLTLQQKLNPSLKYFQIDNIVPIHFKIPSAPYIASNQQPIQLDPIFDAIENFKPFCDVLLIEGAGGLFVPINQNYFMIDLIKDLHVDETLLVTHCDLGCINDTLLSKKALEEKQLKHKIIFNCKYGTKNFDAISKPYFDAINLKYELI